ncbi:BTB/POZ domain-containing protein 6-like [Montipora capricornis]|uniref:BTB/POZ domain-containing protein 6-like n=1 Tax=Montipora capricornis TaxID=246305 RepID=UPI0035F20E42
MSFREENWQTKKPTIRERTTFMFNNDLFSDVKFVVRKSDDESESKQAIPAHKLMLSIGSPVFEAMFYGDLAETSDSIEMPDCEYESLLELFRYLYSDEVTLSGSNVMGVLYLAKKYMVPSLAVKCTEYLQDHLDPSNVFTILVSARKYDEEKLVNRCWKLIDKQTNAAVKSEGFGIIDRPLLEELVKRDTLYIPEVELFKGVVQWADKELARRDVVADGREKRNIIGERIIKAIRFPIMTQDEFSAVVINTRILSDDEVYNLIKHFSAVKSSPMEFPVSKRGPMLMRCSRFNVVKFSCKEKSEFENMVSFIVDRDIELYGVNFFGSKSDAVYSVELRIFKDARNSPFGKMIFSLEAGPFSSILHKSKRCFVFDVLFEKPVPLTKDYCYEIYSKIHGPPSGYGIGGSSIIFCSGVKFTFVNPRLLPTGRVNELIFSELKE